MKNSEVKDHYAFSTYIIDPNRFWFSTVVRILSFVIRWIRIIRARIDQRKSPHLTYSNVKSQVKTSSYEEIASERYFYKVGTREVHQFVKPKYERISKSVDGILHFKLPSDEITIVGKFTSTMKDLVEDTFCSKQTKTKQTKKIHKINQQTKRAVFYQWKHQ